MLAIKRNLLCAAVTAAMAVAAVGCGDDNGGTPDSGTPEAGGQDGGGPIPIPACEMPATQACPDEASRTMEGVNGDITEDTTWTCDKIYQLANKIFVRNGARLTIQPGTKIVGFPSAALIVTKEGKLCSYGTATEPVVFTAPGDARQPGDWSGVALLGDAQINNGELEGGTARVVEGLPDNETRGIYGGTDDTHDCGHIEYTRIEFGGAEIGPGNELNGLTFAGCGSETVVDYVQVHDGSDDNIELFGGMLDLKHVIVSSGQDDGFDFDNGWRGKVQYLIIQTGGANDHGIESDSNGDTLTATPRTDATIMNMTVIGNAGLGSGLTLHREGLLVTVANSIYTTEGNWAVNIEDPAETEINITHSLFYDSAATNDWCSAGADTAGVCADIMMAGASNVFGVDPDLTDPTNLTAPDFSPGAAAPADLTSNALDPSTVDAFFDAAQYLGAIEPGGTDWTAGWSAFPAN